MRYLPLLILLPSCSLVFSAEGEPSLGPDSSTPLPDVTVVVLDSGAQDSMVQPDAPPLPDASIPDAAPIPIDAAPLPPDAMVLPPDASIPLPPDAAPPPSDAGSCDPFTQAGCYVQSNPLGGPSFESIGIVPMGSECTKSSDCAPFMFCFGSGDGSGICLLLCDALQYSCSISHEQEDGICLAIGWQDFGGCAPI